jgi:antitoxin (DNA-binding transcriptional repressor) of toxin-antitoxin stability system
MTKLVILSLYDHFKKGGHSMIKVSIHEAKTHLSSLIADVEHLRETVFICRHGQAVAELIPIPRGNRTKLDSTLKNILIKDDLTQPTIEEWENA